LLATLVASDRLWRASKDEEIGLLTRPRGSRHTLRVLLTVKAQSVPLRQRMPKFFLDTTALAADRAAARALLPIAPETEARLVIFAELLLKWQKVINLVSATTLSQLWTRHFADSLQVLAVAPEVRLWVDLGSGAGFPGLVTAIALADVPGAQVHLIDSDQRKCAFLREVSRETGAPAVIHTGRIEDIVPQISGPVGAVSARALAPMPQLLAYAAEFLEKGALGIFLKGQHVEAELTDKAIASRYNIVMQKSRTLNSAQLLIVTSKISEPFKISEPR
jgi:16S rRNA (guanine527-N7)-methyltransferase